MPRWLLAVALPVALSGALAAWWWLARRRDFEPLSWIDLLRAVGSRKAQEFPQPAVSTRDALYPPGPERLVCEGCGGRYEPFPDGHEWARMGKCRGCLSPWVDGMRARFRKALSERRRAGRVA